MLRDPTTFQFISAAELAQRELAAAEADAAAIEAQLPTRLLVEDPAIVAAELADARRRVVHARAAVADLQSAAEQKAAAARDREERARLRNLRARSGEFTGAIRDLRKAIGETERHYNRCTDCVGAISVSLPGDVVLPPGYWTWTELEMVENASAVVSVVREQITIAAAALRAGGPENTEEDSPEDTNIEDTGSVALTDAVTDANNEYVIGDTSTSTST
jgi:hypothetical protein